MLKNSPKGPRGQAWGVMEILVSVIILGMSMGIAFYVLQGVQDQQCVSQLKSQTLALQNAMLDVALGSPPTTRKVFYQMPSCGGRSVEALRFSYYSNPAFCRACPGSFSGCWLIEPMVYDFSSQKLFKLVDAVTCVNMPSDVDLKIDDSPLCLNNQLSENFCPRFKPGTVPDTGSTATPTCDPSQVDVSPRLNYGDKPQVDSSGNILARSMTFSRTQAQTTFYFQLTKQTGAGLSSTIQVCPLAPS